MGHHWSPSTSSLTTAATHPGAQPCTLKKSYRQSRSTYGTNGGIFQCGNTKLPVHCHARSMTLGGATCHWEIRQMTLRGRHPPVGGARARGPGPKALVQRPGPGALGSQGLRSGPRAPSPGLRFRWGRAAPASESSGAVTKFTSPPLCFMSFEIVFPYRQLRRLLRILHRRHRV